MIKRSDWMQDRCSFEESKRAVFLYGEVLAAEKQRYGANLNVFVTFGRV
ncbi:MAG: hypothetical protein M3Q36_04385 [bacterium]|nr:hypothetical protein [bacterium]